MVGSIKIGMTNLYFRLVYYFFQAFVAGLLGNLFIDYSLKNKNIERFTIPNMRAYGHDILHMFTQVEQLLVIAVAVFIYTFMQSVVVFNLKTLVVEPSARSSGIDTTHLSWIQLWKRFPYRVVYWFSSNLHRLITAWVVVVAYLAFNTQLPANFDEFMKDVVAPIEIMSRSDTRTGFMVLMLATSVMMTIASLTLRRSHREFGYKGRVLEKMTPPDVPQERLVPKPSDELPVGFRQRVAAWFQFGSFVPQSVDTQITEQQPDLFATVDSALQTGYQYELFTIVPAKS